MLSLWSHEVVCLKPHRCWAAQPSQDQCPFDPDVFGTLSPCPVPPDHLPYHRRNPGQAGLQVSAKKKSRHKSYYMFRRIDFGLIYISACSYQRDIFQYAVHRNHRHGYLIDEGHGIDQQLCVHSILLMQDFHGIGPWLAAWKSAHYE